MMTKPSKAAVAGLLLLGLPWLVLGRVPISSAQDTKAADARPLHTVPTSQTVGSGLPPLNVPKSPEPTEKAHTPGTVFVVLRVTDFGTRVERQERQVMARLPERKVLTIAASPDCAILGVKLHQPRNASLENLQFIVTRDRSAVELTAERVGGKGSDMVDVPLTVIEERASKVRGPTQELRVCSEGGAGWGVFTNYALPPIPSELVRPKRRIDVEIRGAGQGGQSNLLLSEVDIKLPWEYSMGCRHFAVSQNSDQLAVVQDWWFH